MYVDIFIKTSFCDIVDVGIDGGARIDESFRTYLRQKLVTTPDFEDKDDIPAILSDAHHDFERHCKRTFASPSATSTVRIDRRSLNIRALQIRRGVLTLDGYGAADGPGA